jgi:hypothetical protein
LSSCRDAALNFLSHEVEIGAFLRGERFAALVFFHEGAATDWIDGGVVVVGEEG